MQNLLIKYLLWFKMFLASRCVNSSGIRYVVPQITQKSHIIHSIISERAIMVYHVKLIFFLNFNVNTWQLLLNHNILSVVSTDGAKLQNINSDFELYTIQGDNAAAKFRTGVRSGLGFWTSTSITFFPQATASTLKERRGVAQWHREIPLCWEKFR